MSRKTILFFVAILAVLLAGVAVAVFFLYSGQDSGRTDRNVSVSDSKYGFYMSVPSDAVAVVRFDRLETLSAAVEHSFPMAGFVPEAAFRRFLDSLAARPELFGGSDVILSLHYVGGLSPLLVVDAGRAGADLAEKASGIESLAEKEGLFCSVIDCSSVAEDGTYLSKRKIVEVSTTDVLINSSERHIARGISVLDQENFPEAVSAVQGSVGQIMLSNTNAGRMLENLCTVKFRRYSDFFRRFSDWTAFSVDIVSAGKVELSGSSLGSAGPEKFVNVFRTSSGGRMECLGIVPSYSVAVFSLPLGDVSEYLSSYSSYMDTREGRAKYESSLASLRKQAGISPEEWARTLDIKEVAVAAFYAGENLEKVLLLRTGSKNTDPVFAGTEVSSDSYDGRVLDFPYKGFASALFGELFSAGDESGFIFNDGWIIAGDAAALQEYSSGRALDNTLDSYMDGAGMDVATNSETHFLAYFSITEDSRALDMVFRPEYASIIKENVSSVAYSPAVFTAVTEKGGLVMNLSVSRIEDVKSKAPEFERDTIVVVPKGPFRVKNSGTGKMNTFYQQDNMYLCLNDENGKGLWGAEFSSPICGRAATVDYFTNGKLQIIFASGSKLYLIDRLGRWVSPFPIDLGKEILLGPDVYDFNGRRAYNVLVLHKDNTVDMYNLKGRKPAAWKGITADETIKDLPEAVKVDGSTYWVVRTSMQTLIFPFYGGDPLTVFEGDRKIRPDSKVVPVKGGVQVTRYDGRTVTVDIKAAASE